MDSVIKNSIPLVFRLAVQKKKIEEKHLLEALKIQKEGLIKGSLKNLEDILLEQLFISPGLKAELIEDTLKYEKQFSSKVVRNGDVAQEDIDYAMWLKSNKKGGDAYNITDIIVDIGAITKEHCHKIIADQEQIEMDIINKVSIAKKDTSKTHEKSLDILQDKKVPIDSEVISVPDKEQAKRDKELYDIEIIDIENKDLNFEIQDPKKEELLLSEIQPDAIQPDEIQPDEIQTEIKINEQQLFAKKNTKSNIDAKEDISQNKTDRLKIACLENGLEAYLYPSKNLSNPLTISEIKTFIKQQGITFGIIDDSKIKAILKNDSHGDTKFIIASGKAPVQPKNAYIKLCFDTDYLSAGIINSDGTMDFKNRGKLPFIKDKVLLAEKIAGVPGENGIDVFANAIEAKEPEDIEILVGKGVTLSNDNLKLYSSISGRPFISMNGAISVFDEHIIEGDVDFRTGHIEFDGNIKVKGTIKNGFRVKGVNVTANEISGGEIIASGNVKISTGIMEAVINAMGDIEAKYVIKSTINGFENITIQKEIIESHISVSGLCSIKRGRIIASTVTAAFGIEAGQVGTDRSKPSILKVGVDVALENKLAEFDKLMKSKTKNLEKVQSRLESLINDQVTFQKKLVDDAQLQDKLQVKLTKLKKAMDIGIDDADKNDMVEAQIEILEKQNTSLTASIDDCFTMEQKLSDSISAVSGKIENIISSIEKVGEKKNVLKKWGSKKPRAAIVKEVRLMCAKTSVSGPNSSIIIEKNMTHINIREIKHDIRGWEMKIG